ncbi:unnamed protein product, partial [Meganyctiphanes norvegica]
MVVEADVVEGTKIKVVYRCGWRKAMLRQSGTADGGPTPPYIHRESGKPNHIIKPKQKLPTSKAGVFSGSLYIQSQYDQILGQVVDLVFNPNVGPIHGIETDKGIQLNALALYQVERLRRGQKYFNAVIFNVASKDKISLNLLILHSHLFLVFHTKGYLKSLGAARTSEVKRDARIGEAEANKDSTIKEAIAEEQRMASKYLNDTEIAKAQRDFELKKASYDMEVQTKKAEAELAYELQAAKTRQKIKEEQMQIKVVERAQEINIQEQEIQRRENELEATVKQPADAEKFKLEKLAEAAKNRLVLEAEAEAEATRMKGEAEAYAIEAKTKAEAQTMQMKADAYKEYKEAAMMELFLDTLPKVAAEVAAPLSQTKKISMVSSGESEVGAVKLTGEVMDIVAKVPDMVNKMTGVDITKLLRC